MPSSSKSTNNKQRSLLIEQLNQRLLLDGAGFIDVTFFDPTPYLSEADTPAAFNPNPDCEVCEHFIETFEDGSLDFGLVLSEGQLVDPTFATGAPLLTDSVDGDDGEIDGTGQTGEGGHAWFTFGNSVTITLPSLMQSAGLVWTDGDTALTDVIFEAFDQDGNSLGTVSGGDLSDDSFMGTTAEDRFFGASYGDGITTGIIEISITNIGGTGLEFDHIQFSNCAACDCEIDLELAKIADASVVSAGDTVTWTIGLLNNPANANVAATGVQVSDVIPAGITVVSVSPSSGTFADNIWTLEDPLAPGGLETLTIVSTVNSGLAGGTVIENIAQVSSANENDIDSTPNNDSGDQSEDDEDSALITVGSIVDLEVTKTVDASLVQTGDIVNWTISITNNAANANAAATGVVVRDVIPAGLTVLGVSTTAVSSYNNVEWTINEAIVPGEVLTLSVQTQVQPDFDGTDICNVAEVIAMDQIDIDSTPNNDSGDQSEDDEDKAAISVADPLPLMLSGHSYVDTNDDGIFQSHELPLLGVEIQLMGTDINGNAVMLTTFTNIDGFYKFNDLVAGDYMVKQVQPVQFVDGQDTFGNLGGDDSVNDKFTLALTDNAVEYNFGELGLLPEFVNKRLYLASTPYDSWEFVDVQQSSIWHSFDADHRSFLDINAVADDSVLFSVFDEEMNPLETVELTGGDVQALIALPDGGTYYLQISGDTVINTLEINVADAVVDDHSVSAVASGEETIELTLGSTAHILSVGGTDYNYDASAITHFSLDGPTIVINGSDLDDVANVLDGVGNLSSSQYTVTAAGYAHLDINGGGNDYGQVYGSLGDDIFSGIPQDATLTTPSEVIEVDGFGRVDAFGRGGEDYATLYGTHGDDLYFARDDYALMSGDGNIAYTKGFERVDAFGRGGDDYAKLYDWDGDETFVATPTYAYLIGGPRVSYTKGFERVDAYASTGHDTAVFFDDANADEEFNARVEYSYMKNSSYLNYASNFDKVRAHSTGGHDVARLLDATTADHLFGRDAAASLQGSNRDQEVIGFESVIAAALAGESPSQDVLNEVFALSVEGTWL